MNTPKPGQFVRNFTSKTGKQVMLRYPTWKDFGQALRLGNELSQEDTFLPMSGEQITTEEQQKKIRLQFLNMNYGNGVTLFCFLDNQLIGNATIFRDLSGRKRTYHIGVLGVSVAKDFRGEGIGKMLTETVIEEARKYVDGLKMIVLHVYDQNIPGVELYKKLGFIESGRIPNGALYKGEYIDELIMYKSIEILTTHTPIFSSEDNL